MLQLCHYKSEIRITDAEQKLSKEIVVINPEIVVDF